MKNFKGLFKDTSITKNPEGTWQYAKNILLSRKFNSPANEKGTLPFQNIKGKVLGVIETNFHTVYFSKLNTRSNASLITLYDRNKNTLKEVLQGNFNFNRPIEGVYKYDYQGNLIVSWCDGVFDNSNSPKITKLTNIDLPLDGIILKDENSKLIELFPNTIKGRITASPTTGNIDGFYAFVTFKYSYKGQETTFKDVNTYAILKTNVNNSGNLKSRGLKITLNDLDYINYDSVIIGLYIVGKDSNNSYQSTNIAISSETKEITITSLNSFTTISNEELLIPKDAFNKAESMTLHKDSIYMLNVKKEEEFKFQKYANLLEIKPLVGEVSDTAENKLLDFNEVYAVYIQLDLVNGETTEWIHLPNNVVESGETDSFVGIMATYSLVQNRFKSTMPYKKFHFENKGNDNKFGYWENEDTYPINDEYDSTVDYDGNPLGGEDLRGKPIRFHRVKEEKISPFDYVAEEDNYNPIIGATIVNLNVLPTSVRSKIKYYRLGFATRTLGNSLIVANGVMVNVGKSGTGSGASDNAEYIDIDNFLSTPFSPEYVKEVGQSFNRGLFLSPELEKFKPTLDFNVTVVKDIVFRDGSPPNKDYKTEYPLLNGAALPRNKFYYGFHSYVYKLPNNSAQGSDFLDGGLYLNYYGELQGYIKNNDSFIPCALKRCNYRYSYYRKY